MDRKVTVEEVAHEVEERVPVTSLMTRQHIYENRHAGTPWWKPAFDKDDGKVLILWALAVLFAIGMVLLPGCAPTRPAEPNPSLVFHVRGTPTNPEIYPEYSRNDKYLGVRTDEELRSMSERYLRHLSLRVRTVDRQSTINGRVRDRHITETRIERK